LIQTPGGSNLAGVNFGSRTRETTGRTGLKSRPLEAWERELDPGIAPFVRVLREYGVETFESCEGGAGHSYSQPAVRFHGEYPEGFRALAVALEHGFPIRALHRCWHVQDGEPVGPDWELTLWAGATSLAR
jgi:hypothetical protein